MGSYNFVVFEKFASAYKHQIAREIMLLPLQTTWKYSVIV